MKFMNTLRKSTLSKKRFLFKESTTSICLFYFSALFFIFLLIDSICSFSSKSELISGILVFGCASLICLFLGINNANKYIALDLKSNKLIISEYGIGFKKEVIDLKQVVKIKTVNSNRSLVKMNKSDVLISIQLQDKCVDLTAWCEIGTPSVPLLETRKMRVNRYKKMADEINTIICGNYSNNRDI